MVIKRFADVVDARITSKLEEVGETLANDLTDVFSEFSDDLSEEEYLEFVKRNMKDYAQTILDTVKDNL